MTDLFERDIVLENDRVKLVPFSDAYRDGLRAVMLHDEEITRFGGNSIRTEEDLERYIQSTLATRQNRTAYPFIAIDKRTGEVAGSTRYGYIIPHNRRLEIGWTWYGRSFRGTGLNKACKFELLRYAFEIMGFRRVQFSVDIDNLRSQRAVLKLGATQEGIFRSNYISRDGTSRDDIYFSIIHSEWDMIKQKKFSEYILA